MIDLSFSRLVIGQVQTQLIDPSTSCFDLVSQLILEIVILALGWGAIATDISWYCNRDALRAAVGHRIPDTKPPDLTLLKILPQ